MNDDVGVKTRRSHSYVDLVDWLNRRLYPALGPPVLGPYDAVVERIAEATCPVCAESMRLHTIDHSTENAVLHCPRPPSTLPGEGPVNELGMEPRR